MSGKKYNGLYKLKEKRDDLVETVYTNYWVNERDGVKKEHASFKTEEEAREAIEIWWELHDEKHDVDAYRTNTGALEVKYGDDNYYYRIEKREIEEALPQTSYQLKNSNQINATRQKHNLPDDYYLFDELAEPYRDRLIQTMGDIKKVRSFTYNEKGQPIVQLSSLK